MKHLKYEIVISASAKKVWETMLQEETYRQWVAKSWQILFMKASGQGERRSDSPGQMIAAHWRNLLK
jgi:hypothetical protein